MIMNTKLSFIALALLSFAISIKAGDKLNLRDITRGEFRAESMTEVCPLADGETYAQISDDRKRIVTYSFKTGKQVGVLFDAATARGAQINHVQGYIISPDGRRLLIQTKTRPIYRRSFTAEYYIFMIQNNKLEPLSEAGPQQTPVFSPDGNQIAFVFVWIRILLPSGLRIYPSTLFTSAPRAVAASNSTPTCLPVRNE